MLHFDRDGMIQSIQLNRDPRERVNYAYAMSVWLKPDAGTPYNADPYVGNSNAFVVRLQEVFSLYFASPNEMRVYFYNEQNYFETYSDAIFVPIGQWFNVQLKINRWNGFEIRVYDEQGRLHNHIVRSRDMQ